MKQFLAKSPNASHRAPLRTCADSTRWIRSSDGLPRLVSYERELRELRREIDELRRDNRRR